MVSVSVRVTLPCRDGLRGSNWVVQIVHLLGADIHGVERVGEGPILVRPGLRLGRERLGLGLAL